MSDIPAPKWCKLNANIFIEWTYYKSIAWFLLFVDSRRRNHITWPTLNYPSSYYFRPTLNLSSTSNMICSRLSQISVFPNCSKYQWFIWTIGQNYWRAVWAGHFSGCIVCMSYCQNPDPCILSILYHWSERSLLGMNYSRGCHCPMFVNLISDKHPPINFMAGTGLIRRTRQASGHCFDASLSLVDLWIIDLIARASKTVKTCLDMFI